MIATLAPAITHLICTELPADGPEMRHIGVSQARRRSLTADELAGVAEGVEVEAVADFGAAVARARDLALGLGGILLVTGSHYVLAPARDALRLCEDSANGRPH